MNSDKWIELMQIQQGLQEKHTHVLMAAAGACIGFSLTQAKDLQLLCVHLALALALISWGASFYYGCEHIKYILKYTFKNIDLVQKKERQGKYESSRSVSVEVESIATQQLMEEDSASAYKNYRCQLWLLILGVLFYVSWQILLMVDRTASSLLTTC